MFCWGPADGQIWSPRPPRPPSLGIRQLELELGLHQALELALELELELTVELELELDLEYGLDHTRRAAPMWGIRWQTKKNASPPKRLLFFAGGWPN